MMRLAACVLPRTALAALLAVMGSAASSFATAQPNDEGRSPAASPAAVVAASATVPVAPDSPRGALTAYLDAARAGDWQRAARYLSLSESEKNEGPRLAKQLKAVLDRHLWFDLEVLSPAPEGRRDDGLPAELEEVGQLPVGADRKHAVRLVRAADAEGRYWAFSHATVQRIGEWYAALGDRRIRGFLTRIGLERLLLPGPGDLLWWQWLALPILMLVAWAAGRLLGFFTRAILGRLFSRTRTDWDDRLLARSAAPLTLAWGLLVLYLCVPCLGLVVPVERLAQRVVSSGAIVAVFWALWRSIDVLAGFLASASWARESPSARNLLTIGGSLGKGVVAGAGVVATLSAFGYPVATLVAGLGIGGLAFAIGAQKTVENLFGSVALAADQPFRVGDFVRVQDFVGNVESIGLRSTRFRTLDRTLISIPNGQVADMRLESFSARDRMRLATTIGVEYGTTHAQMQQVLEGFERVLREHPKIWPDAVIVKFKEFGASSLDIEIMAWFEVPTWGDFQLCRQEVLLGFMRVVEEAGTGFAFPTRTVHLVNRQARTPGAAEPGPRTA